MVASRSCKYLFTAIFVLLVSLAISQVQIKRASVGEVFSYVNFFVLRGFSLELPPIVPAFIVSSSAECGLACLLKPGCVSYNYKQGVIGGTNCEILAVDRLFNSSALTKYDQYEHYFIKHLCDTTPCANNGTCRPDYENNNYTCECTAAFKGTTCAEPICLSKNAFGMEDGRIIDSQLSMSSYALGNSDYGEANGRLNKNVWPQGSQTSTSDAAPWFKIDLLSVKVITSWDFQGYGAPSSTAWTKAYLVSSSTDGTTWQWYQATPGVNKTFPANTEPFAIVRGRPDEPIKGRMIKFWPTSCNNYCSFRLEVYGCEL